MKHYFVQLKLGNETHQHEVSTEGCEYVVDFKCAIRKKFSPYLDTFTTVQINLFKPGRKKIEIGSGEPIEKLIESHADKWAPLVVTVEEFSTPDPIHRSKKQRTYKEINTEASCRTYFNALAAKIALYYEFAWGLDYSFPTINDVLGAVSDKTWKYQKRRQWWGETCNQYGYAEEPKKVPRLPIPLNELFDENEWKRIGELNLNANDRIRDAPLPIEKGKFLIILPTAEFNDETVRILKKIGVKGKLFTDEEDLVVKDEAELSG